VNRSFANLAIQHSERFKTLYRTESQTKTADILGITQAAISIFLQKLEESHGCDLFIRSGKQLKPTQSADKLYQFLTRIDEFKEQYIEQEEFIHFNQQKKTVIKLIGDGYFAQVILPELSNVLYSAFEKDGVELTFTYVSDVKTGFEMIAYHEADLFISSSSDLKNNFSDSIKRQSLIEDEWCFTVSKTSNEIRGSEYDYSDHPVMYPLFMKNIITEKNLRCSWYNDPALVPMTAHWADHTCLIPRRIARIDALGLHIIDKTYSNIPKIKVFHYWNVEKTKNKQNVWLRKINREI